MSHRRPSCAGALRRLLRAQLRLKVMAGVVAVTLVALVAFDVGAVATMRRYLLAQTDKNLQVALTLTTPRLAAMLAAGSQRLHPGGQRVVPASFRLPRGFKVPAPGPPARAPASGSPSPPRSLPRTAAPRRRRLPFSTGSASRSPCLPCRPGMSRTSVPCPS